MRVVKMRFVNAAVLFDFVSYLRGAVDAWEVEEQEEEGP